jgi:hypothetical protein
MLMNAIINLMILFVCQKISMLHDSNNHTIKLYSSNGNYYERGGYECPLYVTNNYKLHLPTVDMHWYTLIGCDSFMYKIRMHRKKVRFHHYLLHTLWCVLICFKVFIGMITPWDPGILLSYIIYTNEKGIMKKHYSYNIIAPTNKV